MAVSLNPLRCSGTELLPPLLLAAKLLAILLLVRGEARAIQPPFLPFLDVFNEFPPAAVQYGLRGVLFLAAAGILFNRRVRECCLALGTAIILSIIACRPCYANNRLFVAALLVMIGLARSERGETPRFLRWQVALVYAGAALNKLLDPDWRSGVFFDNLILVFQMNVFRRAASFLPSMVAAKALSWTTIVGEFSLSALWAGFAFPELTIWAGVLFHTALTISMGITFGYFYFAALIACLTLARWPASRATVLYDGDCGICEKTRRAFERLDLDGVFQWQAFQTARSTYGIPSADLEKSLYLEVEGRVYSGFRAFKMMLLFNPVVYFAALLYLLAVVRLGRPALTVLPVAFFFPLFEPVGEKAYRLVADNRHRLSAACGLARAKG